MATVQNIFTSGRMDSDTDHSFTDDKSYRYALNLRPNGEGKDGTMIPIKGSELLADLSENKTMTVVGMYSGEDNKLYTLLGRKGGFSKIIETDIVTKVSREIIKDSQFLQFDLFVYDKKFKGKKEYILSIDQIDDLLFISSDKWEYPRVINLKRDYLSGFTLEDIVLAKKPPRESPQIIDKQNKGYENDDNDVFISFTYRYKYLDGDYSALSFYSDTIFEPNGALFSVNAKRENTAMVNKWDYVKLMVNSGGKNVTDIEVYAREHGSNTAYLIYSVNKEQSNIADNTDILDVEYTFSKNYEVLNEEDTLMVFSNTPKFPKTQTAVGNRMLYANYKEGYDLDTPVDFTVENIQTTFASTNSRRTAVSMFKYKVSLEYLNDYNESTTALLPINQNKAEIELGFADRLLNNNLRVTLLSPPPTFATKAKWLVKSQVLNYDVLYITYARKIGNKVYLYINAGNVNRVKKDDVVIRIDDKATVKKEYTITDFKQFSIDDGLPLKGNYAVFEIDSSETFDLESNGATITKDFHQTEIQIDAVEGSTNARRYDATSGYEGYGMSGVYYSSAYNKGTLLKSDYGQIKEGDTLSININFSYGRDKKGGGANSTDWFGSVIIDEEIYASTDYIDVFEFLKAEFKNAFLNVVSSGNEVNLITNSYFPDIVRERVGGIWVWAVNNGNREERAVVDVKTNTKLQRGIKPIIFRTENDFSLDEFYFETSKTYPIVNGQVVGDSVVAGNQVFDIGFYNGYCWGNGVESYKIKDNFNAKELRYRFRPNQYDKKGYKQIHRKNDITYSGGYNYELGINNLSVFNPTLVNWKNLPIHYGEIQHIVSTDGDISVFCTDKVISQLFGKAIIYDLQGNENIATTKEVLGDYVVLPYTFGSQNPEGIVKSVDGIYFVDKKRSRYLFKADRQIFEVNPEGSGHNQQGVKEIKESYNFLGTYNESHGEWICGLDHCKSIVFNPQAKGFSHYYDFSFDYIQNMNSNQFTAYNGIVYKDEATENYNVFAGGQSGESVLKYTVNNELNVDKVFKALMLHSNTAWEVQIKTNLTATNFGESAFTQKESFFYSEIYRDNATAQNSFGIGVVQSKVGNVLTFSYKLGNNISSGDVLINEDNEVLTDITDIQGKTITVEDATDINAGDYLLAEKQSSGDYRPDGAPMRGKWMEVTLTKNDSDMFYLTSATTEIIQSKL